MRTAFCNVAKISIMVCPVQIPSPPQMPQIKPIESEPPCAASTSARARPPESNRGRKQRGDERGKKETRTRRIASLARRYETTFLRPPLDVGRGKLFSSRSSLAFRHRPKIEETRGTLDPKRAGVKA